MVRFVGALIEQGAVAEVFAALEKHPDHEGIQIASLRALASLAADAEGAEQMGSRDAVSQLIKQLSVYIFAIANV